MSALPFELISLDLDLTFLDTHHRISPRNLAAVRQCHALGAKVIITSGRMYRCTLPYIHECNLHDTPAITYNGAYIKQENTGEILLHEHLDINVAQEVVEFCAREGLNLNYYLDDHLYIDQPNAWADLYAERTGAPLNAVGDLRQFADCAPTKVLIVNEPSRIARLFDVMREYYAGRAYVTISNAEYLEFMPIGVDKGKALSMVAEHFGIAREKVIAFGDAGNDVPVLRWAGVGVAMENAGEAAKAAADRIAPRHDEDGVAVVLEALFGFVSTASVS
jgi:Cof subfamily protein (haloacid dehalogenase superfamily)